MDDGSRTSAVGRAVTLFIPFAQGSAGGLTTFIANSAAPYSASGMQACAAVPPSAHLGRHNNLGLAWLSSAYKLGPGSTGGQLQLSLPLSADSPIKPLPAHQSEHANCEASKPQAKLVTVAAAGTDAVPTPVYLPQGLLQPAAVAPAAPLAGANNTRLTALTRRARKLTPGVHVYGPRVKVQSNNTCGMKRKSVCGVYMAASGLSSFKLIYTTSAHSAKDTTKDAAPASDGCNATDGHVSEPVKPTTRKRPASTDMRHTHNKKPPLPPAVRHLSQRTSQQSDDAKEQGVLGGACSHSPLPSPVSAQEPTCAPTRITSEQPGIDSGSGSGDEGCTGNRTAATLVDQGSERSLPLRRETALGLRVPQGRRTPRQARHESPVMLRAMLLAQPSDPDEDRADEDEMEAAALLVGLSCAELPPMQ